MAPLLQYNVFGGFYSHLNYVLSTNDQIDTNKGSECPGAPLQRVKVDDRARVCTKSDYLIVREKARKGTNEVSRIPPGTTFTIIDGPSCSNEWSWWKIRTDAGIVGWVSEGGDNIDPYFICPAK